MEGEGVKVVIVFFMTILIGCSGQAPQVKQERSQKLPTATEVFNLRTKCAELGRELNDSLPYGPAWTRTTISNYVPKLNRCYATLEDDDSATHKHYINLYDGQTRDLLAYTRRSMGDGKYTTVGMIFSQSPSSDCGPGQDCGFSKAEAYIDERMKRDDQWRGGSHEEH
jgi:hypothetical protein